MAAFVFKHLTKQKVRPMTSITMYFGLGYFLEFSNLAQDSSHALELITKADDMGGVRVLCARMTITAFPMQDDFSAMMPRLIEKTNKKCDVQFHLGATEPYLESQPVPTAGATGWAIMDMASGVSFSWGYESADKIRRPKLILQKIYRITDEDFHSLFTIEGDA